MRFEPALSIADSLICYVMICFAFLEMCNETVRMCFDVKFQPIDYTFQVNVNFFLCPAAAMQGLFEQLPSILLWPSYRTLFVTGFLYVSVPLAYAYILTARALQYALEMISSSTSSSASASSHQQHHGKQH